MISKRVLLKPIFKPKVVNFSRKFHTSPAGSGEQLDQLFSKIKSPESIIEIAKHPHDSKLWQKWYEKHKLKGNTDAIRAMRVVVQAQTHLACDQFKYTTESSKEVVFSSKEQVTNAAQSTVLYTAADEPKMKALMKEGAKRYPDTAVEMIQRDCLESAIASLQKGKCNKPLVLNMASAKRPGGGYQTGAGAQEENLFRRTNYFQVLADPKRTFDPQRRWGYPLPEVASVYSPSVHILRSTEDTGYKFLDNPIELSFVAVSAYVRPPMEPLPHSPYPSGIGSSAKFYKLTDEFAAKTKRKMRYMFYTGLKHGHDGLILSAFGCGAFKNPANHIAALFKEVIIEFTGCFKYIAFAVIEDSNSTSEQNPVGVCMPFRQTFERFSVSR